MAEVWRVCHHQNPGRPLALKRLLPGGLNDASLRRSFHDEATLMTQLVHPNLVPALDYGMVQGVPYLTMAVIEGRDLKATRDALIKHERSLSLSHVLRIVRDVAAALDYSHRQGVVHRDVTPHNIMVSYDGHVTLMDFGIAQWPGRSERTPRGIVKGKLAYMSPEQARDHALDGRSDMFALGIIFWELLTNKPLFAGGDRRNILKRVLTADVADPQIHDRSLPTPIAITVLRMLQKHPQHRYDDCAALVTELDQLIAAYGDGSDKRLGFAIQALHGINGLSPDDFSTRHVAAPEAGAWRDADGTSPGFFPAHPDAPPVAPHIADRATPVQLSAPSPITQPPQSQPIFPAWSPPTKQSFEDDTRAHPAATGTMRLMGWLLLSIGLVAVVFVALTFALIL